MSSNPAPGQDLAYLANAGLLNRLEPAWKNLPVADVCGAFWSALAVLQSLRSGGGFCQVYLDEAALVLGWPQLPAIDGSKCCYGVYAAAQGQVALAALEAHLWKRFCDALGRHDWRHAALTSTTLSNPVYEQICSTFLSRTAQQWEEWAIEAQIPLRAVRMQPRPLIHAPWALTQT
jgi:alpha-methylacyl-CoA racemase